ncbi:transposase [Undibacterium sp. SXout7W]|uniref:transposase n=1 Tax=Undibacterium sp. SXout7W TaxID=3413049 RepID=UPI003BF42574
MARLPRLVIPQALHHVIQRSHDGTQLFRDNEDHQRFIAWLAEAGKLFQVLVHAYVLMPDHVHLLMTPADDTGLGKMMQWVGRHYVPYFNRKYQRSGSLWQGRFKATVIEGTRYFLPCSIYIESNPVRSRLVQEAADYPWSSYRHHIGLQTDPLIADHSLYWALGNTPFQREAAYKERMEQSFSQSDIDAMTNATLKGWLLGSAQFKEDMSKLTERRIEPVRRGRPRKVT